MQERGAFAWRLTYSRVHSRITRPRKILVIGASRAASALLEEIHRNFPAELTVVGIVDDDPAKASFELNGFRVIGGTRDIGRLVRETGAEILVFAIPRQNNPIDSELMRDILQIRDRLRVVFPLVVHQDVGDSRTEAICRAEFIPTQAVVLCDRFTDSTEAYQGGGRKLGSEPVLLLHRILCGDLKPELTILMDSDVAASVERARRRNRRRDPTGSGENENRFEQESRAFFGRVRNTYLAIAAREPGRVVVVGARGSADETHAQIVKVVRRKLKLAAKTA